MIKKAERPVFNAGNGIRIAKAFPYFRRVMEKLNIPVEDKGTEVKETVTEVPAADINSSDKLNIVIDNAPASVSSPAPVPAAANDNIPLENSAAQ